MFAMFVAAPRDIERPRQRGEREPSFWRGLAVTGLISLAGLALSVLAGLPTPCE
jgi:hypothetical protein